MIMRMILMTIVFLFAIAYAAVAEETLNDQEREAFEAVNALRAKYHLEPLNLDPVLVAGAKKWATKMRETCRFYHGSANENIAFGNVDGTATVRQWERSTPHRSFLLSPRITVAGIGADGTYWTFRARPADTVTETRVVTETPQQRTVTKTWNRTGRARPVKYVLWKLFR
ncbi:hypothetical protein FACS1894189_3520 [Planctomycetales bacterium]|nr:hypothetical protein FACS1894189_3520 [Planctomycetales bacterium]